MARQYWRGGASQQLVLEKLAVLNGKINAAKCCTVMDENLLPSIEKFFGDENAPFIFQHDNASPHAARYTMIYTQLRNVQSIRWPAQSPDLNPIESVCGHMKRTLSKNPPRSKAELIQNIFEIWENVLKLFVKRIYRSIPARLAAVKKCNGYMTKC